MRRLVVIAAVLCLALTACGSDPPKSSPSSSPPPSLTPGEALRQDSAAYAAGYSTSNCVATTAPTDARCGKQMELIAAAASVVMPYIKAHYDLKKYPDLAARIDSVTKSIKQMRETACLGMKPGWHPSEKGLEFCKAALFVTLVDWITVGEDLNKR